MRKNLEEIMIIYQKKKEQNEKRNEILKKEIYEKHPKYSQLEKEIAKLYLQKSIKSLMLKNNKEIASEELKKMQLGDNYYKGKHDILNRVRKVIGQDGNLVPAANLTNNKIVDNKFAGAVDQKTDYLLSKTPSLSSKNENDINNLNKIFIY